MTTTKKLAEKFDNRFDLMYFENEIIEKEYGIYQTEESTVQETIDWVVKNLDNIKASKEQAEKFLYDAYKLNEDEIPFNNI